MKLLYVIQHFLNKEGGFKNHNSLAYMLKLPFILIFSCNKYHSSQKGKIKSDHDLYLNSICKESFKLKNEGHGNDVV